ILLIYQCPLQRSRIYPRLWADHVCYQTRRPNRARLWRRHGYVQANASATRAVPLARLDVVDRDWRRRRPGLPFLAARSSRNEPARLDQSFSEDRLPALRVEDDDATQLRWWRAARLLPPDRPPPCFRPPTRLEP